MITFVYRGGGREVVPTDATHVIFHESVTAISAEAFKRHPNIIEVYCHVGVKKIEQGAFAFCPRLKRVVIPGVEAVESHTFRGCERMMHVECGNLEQIGSYAFCECFSLSSIDLPSVKVVDKYAFCRGLRLFSDAMTEVSFGPNLESVGKWAFDGCKSLDKVVIPLKNGIIEHDGIFQDCGKLRQVDLVEADILDDTITALNLEEWRKDMTAEVASINRILPNTFCGYYCLQREANIKGLKAIEIRRWISTVLSKFLRYKAHHVQLLKEAATALQLAAPNDIVADNVIPFLELPTHTFDGEDNS